jgi:hypothetical protein
LHTACHKQVHSSKSKTKAGSKAWAVWWETVSAIRFWWNRWNPYGIRGISQSKVKLTPFVWGIEKYLDNLIFMSVRTCGAIKPRNRQGTNPLIRTRPSQDARRKHFPQLKSWLLAVEAGIKATTASSLNW